MVRRRVKALLESHGVTCLVSSAACGADLIALSEARALGLRLQIVLPYGRAEFRRSSVTDRPGDWGPLYDEILDGVEASGGLLVLDEPESDEAYRRVNHAILDSALRLQRSLGQPGSAVRIWEGSPKPGCDLTGEFGDNARNLGMPVFEILTR
ncbi:MAG TPA: hypothetical protein VHD76_14765 [Bryobacteraceae bacterium]|jgi:hypothetical protein|nr:hypothetical protein [Bryobacteraceae bacterium]